MKMSKRESGRLGGIASTVVSKQRHLRLLNSYNISPKLCQLCNLPISYEQRANRYCSHSCSASVSNIRRERKKANNSCQFCGKEYRGCKLFCNQTCKTNVTLARFERGEINNRLTIKRILIKKNGNKCSCCGLSTWRGNPLPLELNHKDGNASSNMPNNVEVICSNCHSITPSWKGRNKGSGRKARNLPLH